MWWYDKPLIYVVEPKDKPRKSNTKIYFVSLEDNLDEKQKHQTVTTYGKGELARNEQLA